MGRLGRIVPIRKEYNKTSTSLEACLAEKGYTRFPGTVMKIVPARQANGKFITGLDPDALYIKRMTAEDADVERKKIIQLKQDLEDITGLNLGPRDPYYTDMFNPSADPLSRARVVNLKDEDNIFNLDDPYDYITFLWLSKHPMIASSYQAWERGEYPSDIKFYVADEEVEAEIAYRKSKATHEAIQLLGSMSVEGRRKIARLLGKGVDDNTKEIFVYNMLTKFIEEDTVNDGRYKGQDSLRVFMSLANLDAKMLGIRDLIEQAVRLGVYREDRDGTIREGGMEIAKSNPELALELAKSKNQDKLLALNEKVSAKKLTEHA